MKKLSVVVAAFVIAGTVSSWAQTNSFVVSVKGTITQKDGTKIQVKDVSKGVSGLVSTQSNVLVVSVDRNKGIVRIDEVNPKTTNVVHAIMETFRLALLDSGKFSGDFESNSTNSPNGSVTSFPAGIPVFNGDCQGSGSIKSGSKSSVSVALAGVWNDSINGDTNQPSALFKGTVKTTGTITTPLNITFP